LSFGDDVTGFAVEAACSRYFYVAQLVKKTAGFEKFILVKIFELGVTEIRKIAG